MKKRIIQVVSALCVVAVVMGCSLENRGENSSKRSVSNDSGSTINVKEEATPDTLDSVVEEVVVAETTPVAADSGYDSWFEIKDIDDDLFNRIYGVSFKKDCTVPREDLRYLTVAHYTLDGEVKKGELICNKLIADDLMDIFKNLFNARYPIERMELVDNYDADDRKSMTANNTSCFNFRVVAGSTNLSNHARGLAIDINPLYNPYVKKQKDGSLYVSPKNGRKYADRKADYPYKIDENDLLYKEFIKHGFIWGGHWQSLKDYQHFEKKFPGLKY